LVEIATAITAVLTVDTGMAITAVFTEAENISTWAESTAIITGAW
jgi:hypothetical protein